MARRVVVALGLIAISGLLLLGFFPAAAQTYRVTSYPHSVDRTLNAATEFDSYEVTAAVGREISYSARATDGGCILVLFVLEHNANENSIYLVAYSQETCVESVSRSYRVPTGGGPDFSIVITSELAGTVRYHVEITVGESRPLSSAAAVAGVAVLVVVGVIIGAVAYSVKKRKAARAPQSASPYPPYYSSYPPPPPPPRPAEPQPPPTTPPTGGGPPPTG